MSEQKKCPVDRGKVLIALECCRAARCRNCPYENIGCMDLDEDVIAYIGFLEEQLKEARKHDCH